MEVCQKAIKELKAINKIDEVFKCPDCGAILKIESSEKLPEDIKLIFVKHENQKWIDKKNGI